MKPAKVSLLHRMLHGLKQRVDCNTVNHFTAINRFVNILLISAVISFPSFAMAHGMTFQSGDQYTSFEELKNNEDPSDYRIATKQAGSQMLIMAIHGGGIEPGTSEIANELSQSYSMYLFEGLKPSGNADLHITSTRFDEPIALDMAASHEYIMSLHGYYGEDRDIKVGGTDRVKINRLVQELKQSGFPAEMLKTDDKYAGTHPDNIANKSVSGLSIQLEMSTGFRKSLFDQFTLKDRASTQNETFYRFTKLLTDFLQENYEAGGGSSSGITKHLLIWLKEVFCC
ncbi:poly-gamma-glutamate hydrolase family protein [Bacillus swezeyi]|uniref:poly-gamma-glutamate hydrolase family protein n=1 Tax=Bacillus swezeyi TaxID=1925020 RepID=UPI00123A4D83|nr:poly-gamma-glutamate hydrolase family protein [Bacillus swezeyi]KAA6482420.1 replication protein [Bacillus swezeyi]